MEGFNMKIIMRRDFVIFSKIAKLVTPKAEPF